MNTSLSANQSLMSETTNSSKISKSTDSQNSIENNNLNNHNIDISNNNNNNNINNQSFFNDANYFHNFAINSWNHPTQNIPCPSNCDSCV